MIGLERGVNVIETRYNRVCGGCYKMLKVLIRVPFG